MIEQTTQIYVSGFIDIELPKCFMSSRAIWTQLRLHRYCRPYTGFRPKTFSRHDVLRER
jgi:hypothetical protein